MTVDRRHIPHLAALLVALGQRLGQIGDQAWLASLEHAPGLRAHATTSEGSQNRWEELDDGELAPVPVDPTGEADWGSDPTSQLHSRLRARLGLLMSSGTDLTKLLGVLIPHPPGVKVMGCPTCGALRPGKGREVTPEDVAADGWCRSCFRLDGLLQPITRDRAGRPYYRELCKWCGAFKSEHDVEPPVPLLEMRHRHGRRISVADVERHCPHCRTARGAA